VAFPTETVYGLGANALDNDAVAGIYSAKGRPSDNPLIVHVARPSQLADIADGPVPASAATLANRFWPGPLSIIVRSKPGAQRLLPAWKLPLLILIMLLVRAFGASRLNMRPRACWAFIGGRATSVSPRGTCHPACRQRSGCRTLG
jgi:hypothetical protein